MTELQKLALDALDMLGSMTYAELETACLVGSKQRGGFRGSVNRLFEHGWVLSDPFQIHLTPDGVRAIEAHNIAHLD